MTAPQFRNLPDLIQQSVARFGGNPYMGTRRADGSWEFITYREFGELVDRFRGGLGESDGADALRT